MSSAHIERIRKGDYEVETTDKHPKTIGFVILAITFGLFGTWSALAPIDGAALAPGSVTVESYRKTIQHLEGGIVSKIFVRDGDIVKKDAPLLEFSDTQPKAELEIVKSQLFTLEATLARLKAERDNKTQLEIPHTLLQHPKRDNEVIENEKELFKARLETLKGRNEMIASFTSEVTELNELLREGYVDKQRIRELERRKNDLQNQISAYKSEIIDQLTQTQTKITDLKERETALEDRLSRTLVKAPEDGMILGMKAHTIGGVIRSGDPILDIVPRSSKLIVEAQVSPMDIDRVALGSTADIRFSAFKTGTTPVIEGKLIHLSADRLTDQQTGMPYYLAKLEVTEKGLKDLANLQLLPGMPAEVLIKTGERTLLQYLIQPATDGIAKSFIED